jgi:hypothetical protein
MPRELMRGDVGSLAKSLCCDKCDRIPPNGVRMYTLVCWYCENAGNLKCFRATACGNCKDAGYNVRDAIQAHVRIWHQEEARFHT